MIHAANHKVAEKKIMLPAKKERAVWLKLLQEPIQDNATIKMQTAN